MQGGLVADKRLVRKDPQEYPGVRVAWESQPHLAVDEKASAGDRQSTTEERVAEVVEEHEPERSPEVRSDPARAEVQVGTLRFKQAACAVCELPRLAMVDILAKIRTLVA